MSTLVDEISKIQAGTAAAAREKLLRRYRLEVSVESPDAKTLAKLSADLDFDAATVGKHLAAVKEAAKLAESTSGWSEDEYLTELRQLNAKHAALEESKLQLGRDFDESRRRLGEVVQRRTFHNDNVGRLAALRKANPEIFPADSSKVT